MRASLNGFAVLATAGCLLAAGPTGAACSEPDYVPFSGDVKIACAIDWQNAGENDVALFAPMGGDHWAGWVDSGTYTVKAIDLMATSNSCNGLSLVGRVNDYIYRVFIDAESSTILINLVRDDPRLNDQGHGDCRTLDEEDFSIVIEARDAAIDQD